MFLKYAQNHSIPHMMITLKGRFKGKNNPWWNCVPLADQTKSEIPTRMWICWMLYGHCKLDKQESFLLGITGKRQVLVIITICYKIFWSKVKIFDLSYLPQEYPLYISVGYKAHIVE